jgi:septum site-determining protein MinC
VNAVAAAVRPRSSLRFRGRSFLALVLAPEPPLGDWLGEIDSLAKRSPGFFSSRPVILDLANLAVDTNSLAGLIADLSQRDVRIMGVEGVDASILGPGMPPIVSGGRQTGNLDLLDAGPRVVPPNAKKAPAAPVAVPKAAPAGQQQPTSLLLQNPVRSGQSVIFPQGDVTVLGSVASGAEVIAGGSVHVYGALRGRAIAGSVGNGSARIFCLKNEAELIAIDGLYQTAENMQPQFRGKPIQAWLQGDAILMAELH